ncbi:MAG: M48 family metallopeptidase [Verrucomicrobia bacterium]|nr:M48 family metallopeptidase [Verrucomicrobiota bacterium]
MFEILAQCAHVAVPEPSEEAVRFYQSGNVLWIVQQAWSLIIPLLFLMKGFTGKLGSIAKSWGRNWFFTIAVYIVLFVAIYQILNLPLDFYSSYIRMHDYGLSNQSLERWFSNYGKGTLVFLIGMVAFLWIFYLLLKKSPKRWWFYSGLVGTALSFFMMFIQPIWIDPLFNKFGPMKDKELEQQILQLASRAGIEQGRVFEVDKSEDTSMLNAYVIGFGKTNRIVLWDTLIQQMTPDQILFVMGHEMGHYVLHHIWWSLLYYALLSFVIFYLTYRSAHFLLNKYRDRFGFHDLSQIASLPLLLLLIGVYSLLTEPLSNFVSRTMEHEADRFGLEIAQNNEAAGEAFIALQQKNLAVPRPGPIYVFWRASHPPLGERVDFTNSYCPWTEGKPLKYESHFSQ